MHLPKIFLSILLSQSLRNHGATYGLWPKGEPEPHSHPQAVSPSAHPPLEGSNNFYTTLLQTTRYIYNTCPPPYPSSPTCCLARQKPCLLVVSKKRTPLRLQAEGTVALPTPPPPPPPSSPPQRVKCYPP